MHELRVFQRGAKKRRSSYILHHQFYSYQSDGTSPLTNRNVLYGRYGKHWVRQFNVRDCHAYTVHSLQGLEAENGLVVGCFNISSRT